MNKILTFILIIVSSIGFSQQTRYWISPTDGSWNDANNWSTTLNGNPGGGVPNVGDIVIFSGSDKGDCSVNTNINVLKFETTGGFNGVITFSFQQTEIGSGGVVHGSGTLNVENAQLIVIGNIQFLSKFYLNSGELTLSGNFMLNSETDFDPGTGKVIIRSNQSTNITNNPVFYDLEIMPLAANSNVITATNGLRIYHNLIITPSTNSIKLDGGKYAVGGDFELANNWLIGNAEIIFNGMGNQYLKGVGIQTISFSKLSIDKMDGNVMTSNDLAVSNELNLLQGHLLLAEGNELNLANQTTINGGDSKSFVEGTITKVGSTDFLFPVGSKDSYGPVFISNLSGSTSASCRYLKSNSQIPGTMNQQVNVYDNCAFWNMTTSNSVTMDLSFYPETYQSCLTLRDIADYKILKFGTNGWTVENTTLNSAVLVGTSQTPNNEFRLGSLSADNCVEGPIYWVGTTSSSWDNSLNWSKTSGGYGGYGIPCEGNTTIFDGNGNVDCVLDNDVTITKMLILPQYTSEIDANGNILKITELFK